MLIMSMSKLTRDNVDFPCWQIPIPEIATYLGIKGRDLHFRLKDICKSLLSRVAEVKRPEGGWKAFQFLSHCEYIPAKTNNGTAVLEIQLHPDMTPFLLELKDRFNSIEFDLLARLSSIYAVRLYEFLHHKRTESGSVTNSHLVKLMDLRKMLGLENKYLNFKDVRKYVLNVAQTQFKERTPLCFDFTEHRARKRGAPVVAIEFTLYDNFDYQCPNLPNINAQLMENMERKSREERKEQVYELFEKHLDKAIFMKMISRLEQKGERFEKITENLELAAFQIAKNPKQIKNVVAYCISAIKGNWARA